MLIGQSFSVFFGGIALVPILLLSGLIPAAAEASPDMSAVPTATDPLEALTTETSIVEQMPDGTLRLTSNTAPVRVQVDGEWLPIDTSLVASNGFISPSRPTQPVRFSAGGNNELAQIQTESGDWVIERWPYGNLPTPTIQDATATYEDVLPGVDLHLTATPAGMTEVLEISNQESLASPKLKKVRLDLDGLASSKDAPAGARLIADDGSVLSAGAPMWWDSANDGAGLTGSNGPLAGRELRHILDKEALTLDIGSIDSSKVTFPLFIDPDWSVGKQNSWFTDKAYPNASNMNSAPAGYISVGSAPGGYQSRAFWEFNTVPLAGKRVLNANLSVRQNYSGNCTAKPIDVYRYGLATPGFTWNSDPNLWTQYLSTSSSNAGCSSVAAANVGFSVTGGAQWAASTSSGKLQLGLHAQNEIDLQTRRHYDFSGQLTVTYNSAPNTPTAALFTTPARSCSTSSASPTVLNNAAQSLALRVNTSDPDVGTNIAAKFFVRSGTTGGVVLSGQTPLQSQGSASYTVGQNALAEGLYRWSANAFDEYDNSAETAPCYFRIDNVGPALPGVTTTGTAVVGKPLTVNLTSNSSDGVVRYELWWVPGSAASPGTSLPLVPGINPASLPPCNSTYGVARIECADGAGNAIVTVAPVDDNATLWVGSFDAAGNVSKSGTTIATSRTVQAAPDTTGVSYASGHAWLTDYLPDPLPDAIVDENTRAFNASDRTTARPLTVAPGMKAATSEVFGAPPASTVLDLRGWVEEPGYNLLRQGYFEGGISMLRTSPDGFGGGGASQRLGFIKPPQQPAPSGGIMLYSCYASGTIIPTTCSNCESRAGASLEPLGYIWQTSATPPAGFELRPLHRCRYLAWNGVQDVDAYEVQFSTTCVESTYAGQLGFIAQPAASSTSAPVVSTSSSFTVGAWLNPESSPDPNLNAFPVEQTTLSQGTTSGSNFRLGRTADARWQFCLGTVGSVAQQCATSPTGVALDSWTYVTGIYDAVNGQIRLVVGYTNVSPSSAVAASPRTDLGGVLRVGSATFNGTSSSRWVGKISNPFVFPGVVSSPQIFSLGNGLPPQ